MKKDCVIHINLQGQKTQRKNAIKHISYYLERCKGTPVYLSSFGMRGYPISVNFSPDVP